MNNTRTRQRPARRHAPRLAAALTLLAAVSGVGLAGCGTTTITADTTCKDYLQFPGDERRDAAIRLSSELGAANGGNPMWAMSMDAACGRSPNMTIREYFHR